ncbi:MAG: ABC transporter permease [Proteobacteria bacterium]|nr:ABC transporter permease [Pseudomonadota bacterium]
MAVVPLGLPNALRYLLVRIGRAVATVFGVVTLVFLMVRAIPGDPVDAILGDQAAPEDRAALRRALELDRPVAEQYLTFVGHVADGSLGYSFRKRGQSVSGLIAQVLPATLVLAVSAMAVAWLIAIPLGAVAALYKGRNLDRAASTVAMLGIAIPNIWLGPLLVLLFGVQLRWLPLPGDDPARIEALILPAFTVGTALAAILMRQTRASLLEVLDQQYIVAAWARGLSPARVVFKHALRNALLPVMTVGAAQFGAILSGTVIAEKIFERPGLGLLFLEGFFDRDIPLVQGCVLVIAVIYVAVNLLVDLAYGLVDPRVRLS